MHYYKRNLGDYYKKAGRLSMLQHGAYTLLMDACYDRERFPTIEEALEWCWASSKEEIEAVEFVLKRFFDKQDDGTFYQKHVAEEVAKYQEKAEQNKRIAMEREAKRKQNDTKRAPVVNESPPNQEPRTKNQEPRTKNQNNITSDDVTIVFEYWRCLMNKTSTAKLTAKRKACIKARFNEGYTYDQITSAIKGCASSAFHMGQNDAGKQHNDLTLILRSGDKLEQFMEYLNKPKQPPNGTKPPIQQGFLDRLKEREIKGETIHGDQ